MADREIDGGWCAICGEPVVFFVGTTTCPTSNRGWREHAFVANKALTDAYPVSLPLRVTMDDEQPKRGDG